MMSQSIATHGLGVPIASPAVATHGYAAYTSFSLFIDRDALASIRMIDVRQGDVLRIALYAGHHLNPTPYYKLTTGKPRAAKNVSRTTVLGYVTANDSGNGKLTASVQGGNSRDYYTATIPYTAMQYVHRQITPRKVQSLPASRPGLAAHGMPYARPLWRYQKVKF
jgi:hypothetical protein